MRINGKRYKAFDTLEEAIKEATKVLFCGEDLIIFYDNKYIPMYETEFLEDNSPFSDDEIIWRNQEVIK